MQSYISYVTAELGQRAHVGIVNLDCSVEYGKSTECCINDTERLKELNFLSDYNY